jgi:NAD(P)-dependent dehydrogenase (short-subunit alcohol dehydrogenase family)
MIAVGALSGIGLATAAKFIAEVVARARGAAARRRLKAAVESVAEQYVAQPVEFELRRLRSFSAAPRGGRCPLATGRQPPVR